MGFSLFPRFFESGLTTSVSLLGSTVIRLLLLGFPLLKGFTMRCRGFASSVENGASSKPAPDQVVRRAHTASSRSAHRPSSRKRGQRLTIERVFLRQHQYQGQSACWLVSRRCSGCSLTPGSLSRNVVAYVSPMWTSKGVCCRPEGKEAKNGCCPSGEAASMPCVPISGR